MIKDLVKSMFGAVGLEVRRSGRRAGGAFPADPVEAQRRLLAGRNQGDLTIFDIGANRGQTARRYRLAFPDATIYCFEPFPESVAELARVHGRDTKVRVIPKAVGREAGKATFFVNEQHATNSLLPRPSSARRYFPTSAGPRTTIDVEVVDLDGFVKGIETTGIVILKFDIQGGELHALQGARSLLGSGRVALIYTEIMFVPHYEGAPLFHEIWSLLAGFGYSLFDLYDLRRACNGQLRYGDALFVNDAVRREVIDAAAPEP